MEIIFTNCKYMSGNPAKMNFIKIFIKSQFRDVYGKPFLSDAGFFLYLCVLHRI